MKTATDPRHITRQKVIQELYEYSFHKLKPSIKITSEVINNIAEIDKIIQSSASLWPIDQIAKIDLSILRLSIYELIINEREPRKVIIDEAIELAKEFGGEKSGQFVNGVLGTVLKKQEKI